MNDHSTTFEAVTSSMLKILKEDFSRTDSTLEGYAWKWNQLRQFMENNDLHSLTPKVCDDFLSSLYGSKDLTSLKSGDKKLPHYRPSYSKKSSGRIERRDWQFDDAIYIISKSRTLVRTHYLQSQTNIPSFP